jgi:hypothetical protein
VNRDKIHLKLEKLWAGKPSNKLDGEDEIKVAL